MWDGTPFIKDSINLHQNLQKKDFLSIKKLLNYPGYTKNCSCDLRKVSCLNEHEWLTKMIGIRKYVYSNTDQYFCKFHPAVMPVAMAEDFIETFFHVGEYVLDPFCGTGTTVAAANKLKRIGIGLDINRTFIEIAQKRVQNGLFLPIDSAKASKLFKHLEISLILTSPPYSNILSNPQTGRSWIKRPLTYESRGYSRLKNDLGNMDCLSCIRSIALTISSYYPYLKKAGM